MLDNETKRRIDTARDILVGKVPDPKSQVEQITIALIYKFMDDMDAEAEELGGERTFFSGEHEKYGWSRLMAPNMGGYDVLNLYSEAIQKMDFNPNVPQLFRDIFKNAYLPYRDPETLKSFLKVIDDFEYDHSERLGDSFEYLLSVLGSQGEAGQFRTPRHIIDFMVEIIDPKKTDTILDPACGTAGFLISSYKHILKQNSSSFNPENDREAFTEKDTNISELTSGGCARYAGDRLTPDERSRLSQHIKGYDISPDMVRLSLVNMYLHGFNDPHIFEYDTLTSEDRWNEFADVILANPPFMSPKGGIKPHKRFSVQSKRSEVLFVDYMAEHLTPTGRAGVIVPEGIIFQSGTAYKQLRKMLVENYLFGVVSLPAGVFNPYSGVKTSILLMDKTLAKKSNKIIFVKIENDGFDLGAQRRPITKNDLPQALKYLKVYIQSVRNGEVFDTENIPNVLVVEKEKIGENGDWNLSGERYRVKLKQDSCYEYVKIEDIFLEIKNGINVKQLDTKGKYKVTRIQTIADGTVNLEKTKWSNDEVSSDRFMKEGDILLSHINSFEHLAKSAIYKNKSEKVIHGINLIRFRPDLGKAEPLFIAYLFKNENFIDKARSYAQRAVNQASIKVTDLKQIKIPLPPLEIQKEIVAEIESYQKIIDGARQVVENYKPQIQIDPDWEMGELGEIATIIMGQSPKGESYNKVGNGIPLINGPVEFGPEPFSYTIKRQYTTAPTKICKKEDLVLCVRGSTTGRMNIAGFKACIGRGVAVIRARDNQKWINYIINIMRQNIYELGSGSTFPNVTNNILKSLKIPLPSPETQNRIVTQIEKEQQLVNANKELILIFEQKIKDKIASVWGE